MNRKRLTSASNDRTQAAGQITRHRMMGPASHTAKSPIGSPSREGLPQNAQTQVN